MSDLFKVTLHGLGNRKSVTLPVLRTEPEVEALAAKAKSLGFYKLSAEQVQQQAEHDNTVEFLIAVRAVMAVYKTSVARGDKPTADRAATALRALTGKTLEGKHVQR